MNTSQHTTIPLSLVVGIAASVLIPALSVHGQTTDATQGNDVVVATFDHTQATPTPFIVDVNQGAIANVQNPEVNTGTVVTNVNQENKVYFAPEPTPTPLPTPTPFVAPDPSRNDLVGLLVTDDRASLRPGEHFEYRIVVKNNNEEDIILDKISVRIPEYVTPLIAGATPGATGDAATRSINWISQRISARSEITYTLVGQVDTVVPSNLNLVTTANISGAGVRASASDETHVIGSGVSGVPQNTQNTPTAQSAPIPTYPPVQVTAKTGPSLLTFFTPTVSVLSGLAGLRKFLLKV